jgi:hypothetical protein
VVKGEIMNACIFRVGFDNSISLSRSLPWSISWSRSV